MSPPNIIRFVTALCLCSAPLAETVATQPTSPTARVLAEDVVRLSEWPDLHSKSKLAKEVEKLRKARTDEMADQAREALVETGAAVAPLLIKALASEKGEDARGRILGVLDTICGAAHTRLLASEFENGSSVVRTWALRKVAATPDEGVAAAAQAAFETAQTATKPDDEEIFAAALCLTSAGSHAGLAALFDAIASDWSERKTEIRTALEVVRGSEASELAWTKLASDDRKVKIAALRMLSGCGAADDAKRLEPHLDNSDSSIKVATINALRGMVDGDPPLEKVATFQAIEMAAKWKERL